MFRYDSRHNIIRSLYSGIDVNEIFESYNVKTNIVPFDASIHAFVYCSRRGITHIIINQFLSPSAQKQVFSHELKHIIMDMPVRHYWVGVDSQRHYIENDADNFYKIMAISRDGISK